MFEKKLEEISMFYDFYGQLLTDRQKAVMSMYYNDDYSLAEIAEDLNISRQAVHDSIRKAEKTLHSYEEKLGLVNRFIQTEGTIKRVAKSIDSIISEHSEDLILIKELNSVKDIINKLE